MSRRRRFGGDRSFNSPELRNREREIFHFKRRLGLAAVFIVLAFGGLVARFVDLQVLQHSHYQTLAETNRIAIVPVTPNRGVITDRNGVVLAQSYSAYTLEITPSRVASLDATIDALADIVEVRDRDRRRLRKLMEESKNFESLPLRTKLTDDEVARFAVNRYRFPGVEINARLFRQYPFGELASHVVGYIGRINDRDVERIADWDETTNYKGTDYIGKTGVELAYERQLHGITGNEEVEVDASGRAVRTLSRRPPTSGQNVTLTIDIALQQAAEEAFGDRRGALVALDPANGDVLAMVSKPGYDPNLFVDGIDSASWQELNESIDKPLLNRPLRGAYPPGSTIKPFLALAALESGKRTPTQTIFDPGYYQIAGQAHRFRDDKPGGHGMVDMPKSIIQSCDTYYYMLGAETDIDDTARFLAQFGFGAKTGIDIDGELTGILPSRTWKRERFGAANGKWYLGDSVSAGIGQGYNAFTPLQLAHAIAAIANDGVAYRPHLLRAIGGSADAARALVDVRPTQIALKPQNVATIKSALVGVNREGTSRAAFVGAAYTSAGKTGTAQVFSLKGEKYTEKNVNERLRDHAWFIAYAPADKPRIALAVLVENGGFGASAAAPIARRVLDFYLTGAKPAPATDVEPNTGDDESD
ncbi:MAG TPA: penicillin-binding protein 2 [Casimicrobiaceae bacterium]|nr:penicillin-binding protein 2 [Casimicrobiaceae bacterium]